MAEGAEAAADGMAMAAMTWVPLAPQIWEGVVWGRRRRDPGARRHAG